VAWKKLRSFHQQAGLLYQLVRLGADCSKA